MNQESLTDFRNAVTDALEELSQAQGAPLTASISIKNGSCKEFKTNITMTVKTEAQKTLPLDQSDK